MNKTFGIFPVAIVTFVAGLAAGYLVFPSQMQDSSGEPELKPLYWVGPMDPNYRSDVPGKSPMGMDLVPVYEEEGASTDAGTVTISPRIQNNLGVRTGKVVSEPLALQVNTVGYTVFDEDRERHFHSRVDGWIGDLMVTSTGDRVEQGQKLFDIYAPELVNAQEEYLAASRSGNNRLIKAARDKLASLDVDENQIQHLEESNTVEQYLSFYADRSGYVSHLNTREGTYVTPSMEILSVGELATIWLIAEVFERQASWVEEDQEVVVTSESYPGRIWNARVDYIYPTLDETTRTLRVRILVENEDEALKPNMLVNVLIAGERSVETLTIPSEALIQTGRSVRVVRAAGGGQFKSVPVKPGRVSQGRTEILEGLASGDEVVISGQFLIDSESNLSAELGRIEGDDTGDMDSNNNMEVDMSAHEGMDMSAHEGMDMSAHEGMDMSAHEGMDMSAHESMDMSAHESMDMSAHEGMDMSAHEGMDMSTHEGMDTPQESIQGQQEGQNP